MAELFIKPLAGVTVRDPNTMAIIPETGMTITTDGKSGKYWSKQIRQGMVIVCQPDKIEKTTFKKEVK